MSEKVIPDTRLGRLAFVAKALELPMPEHLRPSLTERDGTPAKAVMAFCIETGASLDFIFCGDIRPMLRGEYYRTRQAAEYKEAAQ